jgi:AraC family chitin signaling transcriptional activator
LKTGKFTHQQQEEQLWIPILGSIILCMLLAPVFSYAQSAFYRYSDINNIRSNELIKGISKDKEGFVWLATDQGVLRYDGEETVLFFKELPSPYTKKFIKRSNGQFLVLTDQGIKEIIQNRDTTYFRPMQLNGKPFDQPLNFPKSIFEDKEGNLWIGEINAVVKISDKGLKRYFLGPDYQSISYHRTFSFTEDAFGHLWIAPFHGRLLSYNQAADRLEDVAIDYPVSDVTCILTVKGDYLLIGGKEGLLKLKVDSDKKILGKEFFAGLKNISTAYGLENEVYVGTWDNGLYIGKANEQAYHFNRVNELPFNDILDFHYDEQHHELWVTGSENIGLLKPSLLKPVGEIGNYRVESLSLDSSGSLYFSTGSQVFKMLPDKQEDPQEIISSKTTYFDRILAEDDKLWIGDAFGGISCFNLSDGTKQLVRDTTGGPVSYIFNDHAGNKWFAGIKDGLVRINPSGKEKTFSEIRNSVVVKAAPDGRIFCGAEGRDSLLYLHNEAEDEFSLLKIKYDFNASPSLKVADMAFDTLTNLLLATNEGLIRLRKEADQYIAERVELKGIDVNEPLKAIALTKDNIWLAYSHALAVYHQGQVVLFTRENGLPSRVLKERCFLFEDGQLFVATAKGLAQVDLNGLTYKPTPKPIFKGIFVNGEKYHFSDSKHISFPYGSRIQLEYVSPSYPSHHKLYQTRLSGMEENWSEPTLNSSMSVLGFSEGDYALEVRARDAGNFWSEPLLLKFNIASPWFKSWWAISLFIFGGIGLVLVSVKVYHFHLINQKKKLQRIIEERTKEINLQKNEIIDQKNKIIQQKEELIEKNNAVFKSQQALSEADLNYLHLKEKQLQDQIEYRNKQITTHTLNIIQKNEMLEELRNQLETIVKTPDGVSVHQLRKMLKTIDESFRLDKDWDEFKLYFEQIYTGFYAKLKVNYPELTNQELRHCALIRLNLSNNECASILGISPNSIKVSRSRLRKKLNLENNHNLTDFVMGI